MRYAVMLSVTLAGCTFSGAAATDDGPGDEGGDPADGGDGDSTADDAGMPDDVASCTTYSSVFDTCLATHGAPLILDGIYTFDTGTLELATISGTPVTVVGTMQPTVDGPVGAIVVESVRFAPSAELTVVGPHPFALAARQFAELGDDAVIDASAGGAGARTCSEPGVGMADSGGASAGGGGGFGAAGGPGGDGDSDGGQTAGGAPGVLQPRPTAILGGCAGAAGGSKSADGAGGRAGAGGGAIYVVAGESLRLLGDASIRANGQGGGGGCGDCGAGGGGSGGMIFLEAPAVTADHLFANGGGGGKGGTSQANGEDGDDGPSSLDAAAGGTSGHGNGGNGGLGGWRDSLPGGSPESAQPGGGGGGGGAAGYIRIVGAGEPGDTISPAVMN